MAPLPLSSLAAATLLLPSALAGKEHPTTKTFKFKEDFFVKLDPLPTAIGPNESVERLESALDAFAETFRDAWVAEIESTLQGGACTVEQMKLPTFSLCEWKYPDRYDVDELPVPGQCYEHESGFVQRIYYRVEKLEITCPDNFSYDDLDKDAYVEAAFADAAFLSIINPPDVECDGDPTAECLFADATVAERSEGYDECTAELYINRFVDVPVYLKCLDQGYGPRRANKIIKALDRYFELVVTVVLEAEIMNDAPTGFVYNFVSPYASDRKYCAHGSYYTGGNLVNQQPDSDGIYVTKFTYGFDVIWYKPKDFDGELLPNVDQTIKDAFEDGAFLTFLREEYPDYDFIQDDELCDVIDPADAAITFPPTDEPTPSPTEAVCDVDTNDGCDPGQVCRLSCVYASDEPQCFDDEVERDCFAKWGPGWVCNDSNGDGTIDGEDGGDGCQLLPPTQAPSGTPTASPVKAIVITSEPTVSPTLRPTTLSPTVSQPPSKFIEPSAAPSLTSMPSIVPTPVPTSRIPTLNPTVASTIGDTDTVGTLETLSPTPLLVRPAETLPPTTSPESFPTTPSPTCPQCIVYPDDTQPDECPIVTTGTCGGGNRGDGICPYAGHCCSEWGWCGTSSEHCESPSTAPTPSAAPAAPTYSVDAGQCAGGDVGDGFCPDESLCCSDWGYCGSGENYCFTTRVYDDETGEAFDDEGCGGGGVGDGTCLDGLCCSRFGFCGEGELYCDGQNGIEESDASAQEGQDIIDRSPLPDTLLPEFGFRCGFSEVDARSNCKPKCTHHIQCSEREECWGVQLNYCNTFEEGEHPICLDLDLADEDSRCGYDEASARGHCGPKCTSDVECGQGEFCFPTLLNLCECHEETCPDESAIAFANAKALLSPYFVETNPMNDVEGKPRSASLKLHLGLGTSLVALLASMLV